MAENFSLSFKDGSTPLFKACHKGHVPVVEHLLNHHIESELGLLKVLKYYRRMGLEILRGGGAGRKPLEGSGGPLPGKF